MNMIDDSVLQLCVKNKIRNFNLSIQFGPMKLSQKFDKKY